MSELNHSVVKSKIIDLKITVAQRKDGSYIAASNASPYFCFVGPSYEAVLNKCSRVITKWALLRLYKGVEL